MSEQLLITNILLLSALFFIVILVALVLRGKKFPYTVGLVIAGMAVALIVDKLLPVSYLGLDDLALSSEVIFYVLLPSLIFEAAINIDSRMLVKNLTQVLALAIPGLLLSMMVVAWGLIWGAGVDLKAALLFGALISATDPVAVIHTFKQIGAPKRLTMLIDGESLFNDATAIVAFQTVMSMFVIGGVAWGWLAVPLSVGNFLYVFVGGLLVGFLVAVVMVKLIKKAEYDPLVQITAMTIIAYVTFAVTQYYLEVSGVMAVLSAGLVINWYGETYLSRDVRRYVKQFWAYIAFIANSFLFLVLGISTINLWLTKTHIHQLPYYALWAIGLVVIARMAVVYALIPLVNFLCKNAKVTGKFKHIIFWGGLRGAVPLALALSLSNQYQERAFVVQVTLAVVLFTLLLQGTTLPFVIHLFKLDKKSTLEKVNEIDTLMSLKRRGMQRIINFECEECFSTRLIQEIKQGYVFEIEKLKSSLAEIHETPDFSKERIKTLLWYYTTSAEKVAYNHLFEQDFISKPVFRELCLNIELTQDRLKRGQNLEVFTLHVPPEVRLKAKLAGWLSHHLPESKLLFKMLQQAYVTKYEISLAMIISCNHIEPLIDRLAKLFDVEADVVQECRELYHERKRRAVEYVKAVGEEDVPIDFRKEKIHQVALEAEYEALNGLAIDGKVLDKVFHELKGDMEREIDHAKTLAKGFAFKYISKV